MVVKSSEIQVGVVGAAGRGGSFREVLEACGARVRAVCDVRKEELRSCRQRFGAEEEYTSLDEMLEHSKLDAVIIGTPMPLHVPQSIAALKKGIHVLCEVTAGVSVDECQQLVQAVNMSKARYMLAENYIYSRPNQVISHIAHKGLFGEIYYAEGEYLHDVRDLCEQTPWRLKWQTGIEGITYCTHSLGPILQWLQGDRVARVCCANTGSHHFDPRGHPYAQDSAAMLCKTVRGALIKIRVDLVSPRPHAMRNYLLQGTKGVYESSRGGPVDRGKIWFEELSHTVNWHDFEELAEVEDLAAHYVPDLWRKPPEAALRSGHSGGDYMVIKEFLDSIRNDTPCRIGIHEAMDMTLPGLISQQSILKGSAWMDVPDSRTWTDGSLSPQLQMIWPERLLSTPPIPRVPDGYELRCLKVEEPADEAGYVNLIEKVGFGVWDHNRFLEVVRGSLPEGLFVVVHKTTGKIVATALSNHRPLEHHPFGGEMGWVGADPEHKGKGLGLCVSAAATARLIRAGYRNIYLLTDDFRLPAIETYLRLGYEPYLFREGMKERWEVVMKNLGR